MTYKNKTVIAKYRPAPMEVGADPEEERLRNRDEARGAAKLPWVPPVIDSFYPNITGLPPGVYDEWCLACLGDANTDEQGPRAKRDYANDIE